MQTLRPVIAALRSLPAFAQGYSVLIDAMEMDRTLVTGDCIFELAQAIKDDLNLRANPVRDPRALGLSKVLAICTM